MQLLAGLGIGAGAAGAGTAAAGAGAAIPAMTTTGAGAGLAGLGSGAIGTGMTGMQMAGSALPGVTAGGAGAGGLQSMLGGFMGGGGGGLGSLLQGSGGQQQGGGGIDDMLRTAGRGYVTGAQAARGDFRGVQQALNDQGTLANQTARTGIAQQESTRRQEEFDIQKAQQAKVDAANAKIAGIFENPKALENITETIGSILPYLLQAGDHAGASASINLLSKAATDKKTATALSAATDIARANRLPDGSYDFGKINDGIAALNDPNVSEVYLKSLEPRLMNEANVVNQKATRQEAGVRADQADQRLNLSERNADLRERGLNASIQNMAATQDRLGRALEMKQGLGPVPPAQLPQYINKNGGNPQQDPAINQGNPTHGDLVQSGYARVPQPVQVQLKQSNIALTQLDRLQGLTDELFKGVTPGKNLLNAAKLKGQETVASGKVREFQTLLLETIPSMAVASGLTPGRVGETVLEKIEKPMMPNLTDTQDTVNGKLKQLKQRLENNREVFFGQGAKMGGASAGVTKLQRNPKTGKLEEVTQ